MKPDREKAIFALGQVIYGPGNAYLSYRPKIEAAIDAYEALPPVITDGMVERACRVFCGEDISWEPEVPDMRLALEAALEVTATALPEG